MQTANDPKIIVALDFPSQNPALELVDKLDPGKCRLKVGKELFTRSGPQLVEGLQKRGFDVFLDLKFHDIPNTTSAAVAAAADLGVWMVNVHASGGEKMICCARRNVALLGDQIRCSKCCFGKFGNPSSRVMSRAMWSNQSGGPAMEIF